MDKNTAPEAAPENTYPDPDWQRNSFFVPESGFPDEEIPLTPDEISGIIMKILPQTITPVFMKGALVCGLEDIDRDGLPEIFIMGVETESRMNGNIFSDFSLLFSEDMRPSQFYLYIYYQQNHTLKLALRVDLGKKYLYGSMARIPLAGSEFPFILDISFQTREGAERELLIFTGKEYKPLSRLSFRENTANHAFIRDIDDDGIMDIQMEERGAQEGTGFETYLIWYKWNGKAFIRHRHTNIVQNLNGFLENVKKLVLKGGWNELVEYCFDAQAVRRLKNSGFRNADIIISGFNLDRVYNTEKKTSFEILRGISEIVFPRILENPFIGEEEAGYFFKISCRIHDINDFSFVSEKYLYMKKNPFQEKQFFFGL